MSLTLAQLLHLKLIVAEHVSTACSLTAALRTGSKDRILEAEQHARDATEAYLKYTDSLLEKK